MLISDFLVAAKTTKQTKKDIQPTEQQPKQKRKLKLTNTVFEPSIHSLKEFKFDDENDEQQQIEQIDKLSNAIQLQPMLNIIRLNTPKTTTSLKKLIEQQEEDQLTRHLKFRQEDVSYLFTLLLNETKSQMKELKDDYQSENEYLQYFLPPFINETLAYVKSTAEDMAKKYKNPSLPLPLRYQLIIDRKNTILGKYLVLEAVEGDFDQADKYTWKKTCISEYFEFIAAKSYIVQIFIRNEREYVNLLGIISKQESNRDKNLIYLPWNSRVINSLKIPNIVIEYDNKKQNIYQLRQSYVPLTYPNFDELYPYQFLVHLNPIFSPATYLIELKALLNIGKSKYLNCLLYPQNYIEPHPLMKSSYEFGIPLLQLTEEYLKNNKKFNQSQMNAIRHSTNYTHPFTLINGPPGTGKTYTSMGIMNIVMQRMNQLKEDSIILACGHSNTVINDWVRKINKEFSNAKVMRIGVAEKSDPDIYDYCLEIKTQRQFFMKFTPEYEKKSICELIKPNKQKYDQLTLIHIKQKISQLNEKIYDLKDFYDDLDPQQQFSVDTDLYRLESQKKDLRRFYSTLVQILGQNKETYKQMMLNNLQGIQIVVSTLTSCASSLLEQYMEDKYVSLCIIDEAPMCFEPSTLIPLSNHKIYKLVLIGDHRQLGPVIYDNTNACEYNYNRSLYERLLQTTQQYIMLNIQYRSMQNLSTVTSQFFYDGKVQDSESVSKMIFPQYLSNKLNNSNNFLFFDVHGGTQFNSNNSLFNEYEAYGVFYLVCYLLQDYNNQNEKPISIITPYRAQVKLIKKYLYKFNPQILDYVEIDTIDAFQGKENDIMIISLVRSEGLGFLTDYRRANVATSRAQYGQFIFGNSKALLNEQRLWGPLHQYLYQRKQIRIFGDKEAHDPNYFQKILSQ
ncbi:unnamed protein product [Paramecium pentaurelia]|uniref:Uncharacterized protein n=1 Tax=Paramecium pentaurelia TaxID=43138 RepID=A0A8S1XSF7_9CILI|nr:unnamed protein product [Paramecium pentaurelia]